MANKIIGGIESSIGRHPYTAALYSGSTPVSCTGFLIAPNVVLTERSDKCTSDVEQVRFGCTDTTDVSSCDETINVKEIMQDYSYDELVNTGIGLIILEEDSIQTPVKLLDMHEDMFSEHFLSTVVSFGNQEEGINYLAEANEVLLEAEVTLVEGKPCLSQYTSTINIRTDPYALIQPKSDRYFCAEAVEDSVRICNNDRGAAALLKCASDNDQDILLGLYVDSYGCGNSGMPPIFSKLNSFEAMAFIRKQLEDRNIYIDFKTLSTCPNGFTTSNVAPTPYPTISSHWFCEGYKFANGDECDCNCGQFDPDCEFPENEILGCLPGQSCNLDGNCVFDNALEANIPVGWICDPTFYDDGEFCDCNCGVVDPDCAKTEFVRGCLPEQTCSGTGRCEGVAKAVPTDWTCIHSFYGTFDGCDCNCGTPDPDCDFQGQEVFGCSEDTPFCFNDKCFEDDFYQTVIEEEKAQDEDPEKEAGEGKAVSVSFNGTYVALGFFATVAFIVHTVLKKPKIQEKGEAVSSDVDHTL